MSDLTRRGPRAAVLIALIVFLAGCGGAQLEFGANLDGRAAPNFALTDQHGEPFTLAGLRGRAVALTFIYTNCPDVCLLTAENFRKAYELLSPEDRERVALVAVTVDPEHDTPERLAAFSTEHGLDTVPDWFALTGDRSLLQQVWSDYWIDPGTMLLRSTKEGQVSGRADDAVFDAPGAIPALAHTDAVFVIDPAGRERALGRSDADPAALAAALEAMIG